MAWICSKGKVHDDFEECNCPDEEEKSGDEEDTTGITTCKHVWEYTGSGNMLDPSTGKSRKVNHYTCKKCRTSKSEWA